MELCEYTIHELHEKLIKREISSEELNELSDSGYKWRDRIGKTGIERTYESYLRGEDG